MRKIANILTENLFSNNIFYNVVNNKNDLINGLPVLCVGVELTKKNYPNFNILNMYIEGDTYWTYGPREKRNVYESRLKKFIENSIEKIKSLIKYKYINILVNGTSSEEFKEVNNLMFSYRKDINSYIFNGIVYIYDNKNIVYGISLREMDYLGENVKAFLSIVYSNTNVIISKDLLPLDIKILFNGLDYLIPYLFAENEKCAGKPTTLVV